MYTIIKECTVQTLLTYNSLHVCASYSAFAHSRRPSHIAVVSTVVILFFRLQDL